MGEMMMVTGSVAVAGLGLLVGGLLPVGVTAASAVATSPTEAGTIRVSGVHASSTHKGFPSGTHNWYTYPDDPMLDYLNAVTQVSGSKVRIAIDGEDKTTCYKGTFSRSQGTFQVTGKSHWVDDYISDDESWSGSVHWSGKWLLPDTDQWKAKRGKGAIREAKDMLAYCKRLIG